MAKNAQTVTLAATVAQTVVLTAAVGYGGVEVTHHGNAAEPVFIRTDDTDPVVDADECDVVLGGQRVRINAGETGEIRLVSAGAPKVTLSLLT